MSQPENKDNQSQQQGGQSQQQGGDLGNELRELGQQLEAAVRSAIQSDKAKQVQQDVSSGMKEIAAQLQSAFKAIQENPRVHELVERGEQAVSQAQQSKVAQDFRETLARGIAQLSDQLAAFATRMRQAEADASSSAETPPATGTPTTGTPATGETTRLDPNNE